MIMSIFKLFLTGFNQVKCINLLPNVKKENRARLWLDKSEQIMSLVLQNHGNDNDYPAIMNYVFFFV